MGPLEKDDNKERLRGKFNWKQRQVWKLQGSELFSLSLRTPVATTSFRQLALQACCARTVQLRDGFGNSVLLQDDGMKGMSWFVVANKDGICSAPLNST